MVAFQREILRTKGMNTILLTTPTWENDHYAMYCAKYKMSRNPFTFTNNECARFARKPDVPHCGKYITLIDSKTHSGKENATSAACRAHRVG